MKKTLFAIIIILSINHFAISNDTLKIKSFHLGLKIALPNYFMGLSMEYNGICKNRLSLITNLAYIPSIKVNKTLAFSNNDYSVGINYKFLKQRAFFGLGMGYMHHQCYDSKDVVFFDASMNKIIGNLVYNADYWYIKPNMGYKFIVNKFYIKPEIEYYIPNKGYSKNNWQYFLENGEKIDGNELFPVKLANLTVCLTIGFSLSIK